ncbi:hypothetical protein BLOT_010733 [Blomia tropicalis]|nr:hypothetical protein BLOT_010733 [Blomia tropicalis]
MDYEEILLTDDEEFSFSINNRLNKTSTKPIIKNEVPNCHNPFGIDINFQRLPIAFCDNIHRDIDYRKLQIQNTRSNQSDSNKPITKQNVSAFSNELIKNVTKRGKSENVKIECIDLLTDDDESLDGEIECITIEETEELANPVKEVVNDEENKFPNSDPTFTFSDGIVSLSKVKSSSKEQQQQQTTARLLDEPKLANKKKLETKGKEPLKISNKRPLQTSVASNVSFKRFKNPRYSACQSIHSVDNILYKKRELREKNYNKDKIPINTNKSTPESGRRQFGRAFSPTIYSPSRTFIENFHENQQVTTNELNKFLETLLSIDPIALKSNYSEDLITQHLRKAKFLPISCEEKLPLTYETFDEYKKSYFPLILYDNWSQIVEEHHANNYKRHLLWIRHTDLQENGDFITICLKGVVASTEIYHEDYFLDNWIVLLIVPSASSTNNCIVTQKDAKVLTSTTCQNLTIGFVQNVLDKLEVYSDINSVPEGIPILGQYDRKKHLSLSAVEYVVKLYKSQTNIDLIKSNRLLYMQAIYYFRPTVRLIETLSMMRTKTNFIDTFLKPRSDVTKLDWSRHATFKTFFEEKYFNEEQRKAILASYNAVQQPYSTNRLIMIQGPPGTGKTHTLVGIVKNILINCSTSKDKPLRILVCSPSNGAIDEIALRLIRNRYFLQKFKSSDRILRIVRIGQRSQVHPAVKKYLLDELIEFNISNSDKDNTNVIKNTKSELRDDLLLHADVILSTLNSVSLNCMSLFREENISSKRAIRCVIIDEASQCTEPELLMPLIYPISKIILIGDHLQLPATVISRIAFQIGYGRSMFERFNLYFKQVGIANSTLTLRRQYRMEKMICKFPSQSFYNNQLITPEGVGNNPRIPLQSYMLFDFSESNNNGNSLILNNTSRINVQEVEFIFILLQAIFRKLGYKIDESSVNMPQSLSFTIGIITFYRKQKEAIYNRIQKFMNGTLLKYVDINTVDAFQGQERDIVILSCVRELKCKNAIVKGRIGFLRSHQRMNVALTRSKSALYICIHGESFSGNEHWKNLLIDSQLRKRYVKVNGQQSIVSIQNIISKK